MKDFLAMGGYGAFVWPAYVITAVTLAALALLILRRARTARRRLSELEKRDG